MGLELFRILLDHRASNGDSGRDIVKRICASISLFLTGPMPYFHCISLGCLLLMSVLVLLALFVYALYRYCSISLTLSVDPCLFYIK